MYKENFKKATDYILSNADKIDKSLLQEMSILIGKVAINPNISIDVGYELRKINRMFHSSNGIIRTEDNQQNDSNFIDVDWAAFLYGSQRGNCMFGSYLPYYYTEKGYLLEYDEDFIQIYKDNEGKIHLKYQPSCLVRPLLKEERTTGKHHYLELILSDDTISRVKLDYDTIFKFSDDSELFSKIEEENRIKNGYSPSMDKLRVMVSDRKIDVSEKDTDFLKILITLILENRELFSRRMINMMNDKKELTVTDVIYLYNAFMKAGCSNIALNKFKTYGDDIEMLAPYPVTPASNDRMIPGKYHLGKLKWIRDADKDDYPNTIMIQSNREFLDKDYSLDLDVNNGICNNSNIRNVIDFVRENHCGSKYIDELKTLKNKVYHL